MTRQHGVEVSIGRSIALSGANAVLPAINDIVESIDGCVCGENGQDTNDHDPGGRKMAEPDKGGEHRHGHVQNSMGCTRECEVEQRAGGWLWCGRQHLSLPDAGRAFFTATAMIRNRLSR